MDFHAFPTNREACCKAGIDEDEFYELAFAEAIAINSPQFFNQLNTERDWEQARKPYYNVWPSIVPMLTRLDLDLDSALIQLPMPALCIRLPMACRCHERPTPSGRFGRGSGLNSAKGRTDWVAAIDKPDRSHFSSRGDS